MGKINILLVIIMLIVVSIVYRDKYRAERIVDELETQRAAISRERIAIAELRAEWYYLNRPERLQALIQRHGSSLNLAPISPEQISSLEDIPLQIETHPPANETNNSNTQ